MIKDKWRLSLPKSKSRSPFMNSIILIACSISNLVKLRASVQSGYQLPQNSKDYASEISGWRFRASP